MNTSERINKILLDNGLDTSSLSESTGVNLRSLQRYLSGDTERIQVANANKISKIYPKYSPEWIMGKVKNDKNENEAQEPKKEYGPRRIEDIIAGKVIDKLKPLLSDLMEKNEHIIRELAHQSLDVDELKDELQELKNLTSETHQALIKK